MKILIQDTDADRLVAWLSQINRPGRVCHLANTSDQARWMLMNAPYDMVLLEGPEARADRAELARMALQRNPKCKVVNLPAVSKVSAESRAQTEAQTAPSDPVVERVRPKASRPEDELWTDCPLVGPEAAKVRWRQFGRGTGEQVITKGGVKWRGFRKQRTMPDPSPEAPVVKADMAPPTPITLAKKTRPTPRSFAAPDVSRLQAALAMGREMAQRAREDANV